MKLSIVLCLFASAQAFTTAPLARTVSSMKDTVPYPFVRFSPTNDCLLKNEDLVTHIIDSARAFLFTLAKQVPTTQLNLLSQEESDKVLSTASDCVEGECSLDEIDGLITLLKDQQKEASSRLDEIKSMIKSLETVNSSDDRSVDEIRETVRAIFRVFQLGDKASGNDYPALSKPMGYSGDVGKGPQTAYDALPPKPYKKATP